uniref:Uncharacterized protein n=1 Tax=Pseudictyota dubia TaxID=2749911 RepID=A0A7R9ZGH4_9STRA
MQTNKMKVTSQAIFAFLSTGYAAAACTNSATFGGLDQGCSAEEPICIDSSTGTEVGYRNVGDDCAACLRVYTEVHYNHGLSDFGCSGDKPRCMSDQGTDPSSYQAGGQCCDADGTCSQVAPVTCPCNLPGGWIDDLVNGDTQLTNVPSSEGGYCRYDDSAEIDILLYNGEGYGSVYFRQDLNQWRCESTEAGGLEISEAEAQACAADLESGLISNDVDIATQCVPFTSPTTCPCNTPGTWVNDFVKGDEVLTNIPSNDGYCSYYDTEEWNILLINGNGYGSVFYAKDLDQWTCESTGTAAGVGSSITEAEARACISDLQNGIGSAGIDVEVQCSKH